MRIGVSSTGRWWVSMGPLGMILTLAAVLPVLALLLVVELVRGMCQLARMVRGDIAAWRRRHQEMHVTGPELPEGWRPWPHGTSRIP